MKRIAIVLAALLAADAANAEFKRLPRRTDVQVVPKPAAKQEVIVLPGPETPPPLVLPSPSQRSPSEAAPLIQFTVPAPTAAPTPAPTLAAPKPAAEPPAPVAAPAPVLAPAGPAPSPPAPPAIATPVRVVPTPPSQPIAAPAPAVTAPLAVPAPVSPVPVAAPAPLVPPPLAAPPPVTRPPVVAPAPVAPPPVAAPAPAAAPPVAAPTPVPSPSLATVAVVRPASPPRAPDSKLIENIFACLAPGLPQDWAKTWIVVTELADTAAKERRYEAKFFYATLGADDKSEPLTPCNSKEIARQVHGMNDFLAPEKRNWREARLLITHEGRFELKYDYAQ